MAENLLDQPFSLKAPSPKWGVDLSYSAMNEGRLCLLAIKDVFTCEFIGDAMSEPMAQVKGGLTAIPVFNKPLNGVG